MKRPIAIITSLWLACLLFVVNPVLAGTIYVDTGGTATNSGSTDSPTATVATATSADTTTTIQFPASTDLSGVVSTAGPTQSTVYLTNATATRNTVANTKIYWVTGVNDGADTITVDLAPACTAGACGPTNIGGQYVWPSGTGVNIMEPVLRAGDVLQFNNSPATRTATYLTPRSVGDSTSGPITIRGKAGVFPLLNITNTTVVLTLTTATNWVIDNLDLKQDGASGNVITGSGNGLVLTNSRLRCGGTAGIGISNTGASTVINNEVSNCGLMGMQLTSGALSVSGNYIHDNAGDGIAISAAGPSPAISNNILDTNTGKGIYISSATTASTHVITMSGNTFYGNGVGLQIDDADTVMALVNNIFSSNTSNINIVAGSSEFHGYHGYNILHNGTLTNFTANATELTTDPLFTNAASGDFSLGATSPAKSAGSLGIFPGGLSVGHLDIGAVQRLEPSGGSGGVCIGC